MKVTFIGTGTSQGVPVINCSCDVCRSDDPRNNRLRTSVTIQTGQTTLLIDTTTDLRQQLLRYPVQTIDAVLYTHAHEDHICGIDDLRAFNFITNRRIPAYGSSETIGRLTEIFSYAFGNGRLVPGLPNLEARVVDHTFRINELEITPLELHHGQSLVLGYRIGSFAYCTDVSYLPEHTASGLKNLDVLVLDALRHKPHPTHFSIEEALNVAGQIGAAKTYLIHMSHNVDHEKDSKLLPENIYFAYDGLTIDLIHNVNSVCSACPPTGVVDYE